jgi:hypothetical protein
MIQKKSSLKVQIDGQEIKTIITAAKVQSFQRE